MIKLNLKKNMKNPNSKNASRMRTQRAKKLAGLTEGEKESARKAESQRRAARRLRVKIEG